jgi:hypothetical protein
MSAARYDIYAEQGTTFKLYFNWKLNGVPVNLSGYSGDFQVRRSLKDEKALLYVTTNGVTGGGITGDFTPGVDGILGVGGISFNTSINGTGETGGILFKIDDTTMTRVIPGKHFYDFKIKNTSGDVKRLIEGTFDISKQITRI